MNERYYLIWKKLKKNTWLTSENIQSPTRCTKNEEVLRNTEASVLKITINNKLLSLKAEMGKLQPRL
jgi:hypothetical protein